MRKRHLLIAALAAIFSSTVARAATFHIPRGDVDALITAIQTANSNFEDDIITVAGTYTFATPVQFSITQDKIRIRSRGRKTLITYEDLDTYFPSLFRVFSTLIVERLAFDWFAQAVMVSQAGGSITISKCVVTGGSSGSLENYAGGRMTIDHSLIYDNDTGYAPVQNWGFMSLYRTTVARNVLGGPGTGGGGISNFGTLVLNQSRVMGNEATDSDGGGIYNGFEGAIPPTLVIDDSRIIRNESAYPGGGISQRGEGSLTVLRNSVVARNKPDQIAAPEGELIRIRTKAPHGRR